MYRAIILEESKNNFNRYLSSNRQILRVVFLIIKSYLTL